ncbi:DNA pol B 2 domain-containing protein [Aphis craccivora]|uniref:DNA pol B 2 domain-containing protein n=1 Tax=Aphis craccivora TaxID=307492 RepID=A0A6G0X6F9_APHCR|nr:DNA pol B 2 domain-containing protein [Aphis craccivora]
MIMNEADEIKHRECKYCELCKCLLINKVRDYCQLTEKFRMTLCSSCNLELKQPKFVPCFFHNLSNYDGHFIVTELGNTFTVRFIDTFGFMPSSLESLASNLLTPGLEKFRDCHTYS